MVKLRYFTKDEINLVSFGCEDGYDRMSIKALLKFDELRHQLGFPLVPTCAFRTFEFDKLKGRSGNSTHTKGIAMDFSVPDHDTAMRIMSKAYDLGFRGIAYNIKRKFVHVDCRDGDLAMWQY